MDAPPIELRILDERLHAWGLPRYHSAMAAGIDLHACLDEPLAIAPGAPAVLVPSGLAMHLADPRLCGIVVPRSGLGHRLGLVLGNTVGVIDADYTGQILVSLWNRSAAGSEPVVVAPGDRVAQLLVVPIVRPELRVVASFTRASARADGGFGSTGTSPVAPADPA